MNSQTVIKISVAKTTIKLVVTKITLKIIILIMSNKGYYRAGCGTFARLPHLKINSTPQNRRVELNRLRVPHRMMGSPS